MVVRWILVGQKGFCLGKMFVTLMQSCLEALGRRTRQKPTEYRESTAFSIVLEGRLSDLSVRH